MPTIRPLAVLLVPMLLAACDRPSEPSDPIEPVASATAASSPASASGEVMRDPATPAESAAMPPASARAVLMPTSGNTANGDLRLQVEAGALRLTGTVSGLGQETVHGFHIHETGDCSAPDASSAGPHFNPTAAPHGEPGSAAHHGGDLPNLVADGQGNAAVNLRLPGLELGGSGTHDVLGRALVLHAQRDDYQSQPAGDSGARIACGVIQRATDVAGAATSSDAQTAAPTEAVKPAPGS